MKQTVKQRIEAFRLYKGLSANKFEITIGVSQGYLSHLVYQPKPNVLERIFDSFPDLNRTWLMTGEGEMLCNGIRTYDKASEDEMTLPLIPVEAMAGFLTGDTQQVTLADCDIFRVPIFKGAEFLIRVSGDSMTPKFLPGDIVACKRVFLSNLWFQWGKVYVLDTQQGALLKRITKSEVEGCVRIVSINELYEPFDLDVTEINGLALVIGLLRVE